MANDLTGLNLAVVGAGPVGLALALQAAQSLPGARISVFDARPLDKDVSGDPRTLALSLGSIQMLEWLGVWNTAEGAGAAAQPITEVHVSQQAPSLGGPIGSLLTPWIGEPEVRIRAADEGVAQLGAVLSYGAIVAPLQRAWLARCAAEPMRLASRYGTPVTALKPVAGGVEVDAGIAERFDLAVVAEGGVFADQARKAVTHDYRQTAWVGTVEVPDARPGVAYERFTRHGPAALLPRPGGRAALVWCVGSDDDPVAELDDAQRLLVLNTLFAPEVGRIAAVSPLKHFPLGLNAERTLTEGRTVRIGNAAQTLHPVAGQGLNLGLRDAHALVRALARGGEVANALRRIEWQRAPDRWAMIAATDFLARSFTWSLPGAGAARGLGMAALQALGPVKSLLARQMMFGSR
ncbi:MAG: FAD-dependent monooxygenase [Ideonella sp.]|nr:FAD-dependent monooxygenase [Ideonella sp.]